MTYREHHTDGRECWCHPQVFVVCDECDGEGHCWRCDPEHPGLVPTDAEDDGPLVIVHNEIADRAGGKP